MSSNPALDPWYWLTPFIYLALFYLALPFPRHMPLKQRLRQARAWSPVTHGFIWFGFLFICALMVCAGVFSTR